MMAEWTFQRIEITDEGDVYTTEDGNWEVRNVIGSAEADPGDMTDFWERHASGGRGPRISLRNQPCGIHGCGNKAEEGGHVWLRRVGARNRLRPENERENDYCFIMPICRSCNRERENRDEFFGINQDVRLVAREVRGRMR